MEMNGEDERWMGMVQDLSSGTEPSVSATRQFIH
jgi:hypothetical protein